MTKTYDWKSWAVLLITLAGVFVPIWVWQIDKEARSVQLEVISSTDLNLKSDLSINGLKFSLDGRTIADPRLTVLELNNSGNKSLPQTDFESPVEIGFQDKVEVVRAEVTLTKPKDLMPMLTVFKDKILIKPLLLNPNDSIRIVVLTSGEKPQVSVRSRIAGISKIEVLENTLTKSGGGSFWYKAIVGVFLVCLYFINAFKLGFEIRFETINLNTALTTLFLGFGGTILIRPLVEAFPLSLFQYIGLAFILLTLLFPVCFSYFKQLKKGAAKVKGNHRFD